MIRIGLFPGTVPTGDSNPGYHLWLSYNHAHEDMGMPPKRKFQFDQVIGRGEIFSRESDFACKVFIYGNLTLFITVNLFIIEF